MFSRDGSAHVDAEFYDLVGRGDDAAELVLVARVKKNQGMQVAIASMKDVADLKPVLLADFVDMAERGRKLGPGNHAILHVVRGGEASDGAEGVLAAFPQQVALARVTSDANFARVVFVANVRNVFGVLLGRFFHSVAFDQQSGGTIGAETGVNVGFDGAKRPAV